MSNETQQETWNATHAQLLKSVADAQGKLLAAQNETNDRLERQAQETNVLIGRVEALRDILSGKLDDLKVLMATWHDVLSRRSDALEALLVPPRRPVERTKRNRR